MTGDELKRLRKRHNLTLREVADAIGLTWQAVQKKEAKGGEQIEWSKQNQIVSLANLFNEPVSVFYPSSNTGNTLTANNGSAAQVSGGDSSAVIGGGNKYAPKTMLDEQLFRLILEVATDNYKKTEIQKLLKVKELLGYGGK